MQRGLGSWGWGRGRRTSVLAMHPLRRLKNLRKCTDSLTVAVR
jgi:hypothetical protein